MTLLVLATSSVASDDTFQVIVHRDNPITTVDRDFLRDAFLKKTIRWNHGTVIRPIDLGKGQVRDRFTRDVLKKTPSQVRSYWTQRIFSGTAVPTPQAESADAALAYVLANPGAVAYVPTSLATGTAKVVKIH